MSDTAQAASPLPPAPLSPPPSQWPVVIVTIVVLLLFGAVLFALLTRSVPQESSQLLSGMLGSLGTMATGLVWFWTGSSVGSKNKDHIIGGLANNLSQSS